MNKAELNMKADTTIQLLLMFQSIAIKQDQDISIENMIKRSTQIMRAALSLMYEQGVNEAIKAGDDAKRLMEAING